MSFKSYELPIVLLRRTIETSILPARENRNNPKGRIRPFLEGYTNHIILYSIIIDYVSQSNEHIRIHGSVSFKPCYPNESLDRLMGLAMNLWFKVVTLNQRA